MPWIGSSSFNILPSVAAVLFMSWSLLRKVEKHGAGWEKYACCNANNKTQEPVCTDSVQILWINNMSVVIAIDVGSLALLLYAALGGHQPRRLANVLWWVWSPGLCPESNVGLCSCKMLNLNHPKIQGPWAYSEFLSPCIYCLMTSISNLPLIEFNKLNSHRIEIVHVRLRRRP